MLVRGIAVGGVLCAAAAAVLCPPARASEDPLEALLAPAPGTLAGMARSIRGAAPAPLPADVLQASPGAAIDAKALPASGKEGDAPRSEPMQINLQPAARPTPRSSDGGIVISDALPVSIVGFWGYGGQTKGEGYRFTGTGYEGVSGTSRVLPVSLSLAGLTADPRQNIYSAELRAELPMPVSNAVEFVPYAGFRAVRTQQADADDDQGDTYRHALNQIPAGIGVRVTGPSESETQVALRGQVGAVANLGSTGTLLVVPGARSDERSSVTGIGSVGIEIQRDGWNFGAGADIGVSSRDKTEKGFSVNIRREF